MIVSKEAFEKGLAEVKRDIDAFVDAKQKVDAGKAVTCLSCKAINQRDKYFCQKCGYNLVNGTIHRMRGNRV